MYPMPMPMGGSLSDLKLQRAQLAANLPSDEQYEALKFAQMEAQDAQREAAKVQLAELDTAIQNFDKPVESSN